MDKNERNEHFQGFARLLWEEMLSQTQGYYIDVTAGHIPFHHPEDEKHKRYIYLIAQRAYDLTMYNLKGLFDKLFGATSYYTPEEIIRDYIPDLTEWST